VSMVALSNLAAAGWDMALRGAMAIAARDVIRNARRPIGDKFFIRRD
jgi:hypothetical protein